jgi:two-component sensor histidine kinase
MEMALNEQKVLLAEVNHRVKNNLAVIISLLNLQGYAEGDEKVSDALKEIRNRVMSMSLVHNKMYQNKDKNSILLDLYIRELVDEISTSINMQKKLNVDLDLANISINLSQAIPLGLILNELITNSMKHAFKGIEEPKIIVRLTVLNETDVELIYKDNGIGIDPGILELNGGLGLELMRSLSEQMDAISTFSNESGLTFKLTFAREGIA